MYSLIIFCFKLIWFCNAVSSLTKTFNWFPCDIIDTELFVILSLTVSNSALIAATSVFKLFRAVCFDIKSKLIVSTSEIVAVVMVSKLVKWVLITPTEASKSVTFVFSIPKFSFVGTELFKVTKSVCNVEILASASVKSDWTVFTVFNKFVWFNSIKSISFECVSSPELWAIKVVFIVLIAVWLSFISSVWEVNTIAWASFTPLMLEISTFIPDISVLISVILAAFEFISAKLFVLSVSLFATLVDKAVCVVCKLEISPLKPIILL